MPLTKRDDSLFYFSESDIFKFFGVNPKDKQIQKAWSMAWELGHSSGYFQVTEYFDELLDLIHKYDETLYMSTVIGCLELVKQQLINENVEVDES